MYAIKISSSGRFINWCDRCWYETIDSPMYIFTLSDAKAIAKQLQSHYVYKVEIIDRKGYSEIVDAFNKNIPIEEPKTIIKKIVSKLKIRI